MIKPVNKVFEEQFWRELQTNHKAATDRVKFDPYIVHQDAAVIHWTSEALKQERLKKEKK